MSWTTVWLPFGRELNLEMIIDARPISNVLMLMDLECSVSTSQWKLSLLFFLVTSKEAGIHWFSTSQWELLLLLFCAFVDLDRVVFFFVVFCRFATSRSRALYRVFCFLNLLSSADFTSQKHYIVIFFFFFCVFLGFQCYDSSLWRSVLLKIANGHVAIPTNYF